MIHYQISNMLCYHIKNQHRNMMHLNFIGQFGLGLYAKRELHDGGGGVPESPNDRPGLEQGL